MKKNYRIVTDRYNGYEAQVKKRFLFWTYWVEISSNTHQRIEDAEAFINRDRKEREFKSTVVKEL